MSDFEKMGSFYLGREYDAQKGETTDVPLLFDARDLTTHGVIIGMTGSGKTGLAVSIIEEAILDGVPAIVIDPKGDMPNLLLAFPELAPADFEPWIDPAQAEREGLSPGEMAAATAERWKQGLAGWGIDGDRIKAFKDAAEVRLFTPGSTAGRPVRALQSFDAPPKALRDDADLLRDRVQTTVSGLLTLLGIDGDPLTSREHILLSSILDERWREGRDLDLPGIIGLISSPPFDMVGVLPLETFYPSRDRMELAMQLNHLLAAPGFSAWLEGEPLDAGGFLFSPEGKPRLSIFTISHLSERERMFFVSLLLNQVLGWMRTQPGTSSLRALLYMDEIFGYFPPVKEPPAKKVLLTLLKQARAYGLGVLLATQNPVDLDYKGLANTGAWFIGRLQTEQDREKVLDGLQGALPGASGRSEIDRLLSGIRKRVFLLHNVHDDAPVLFGTRFAMSYLAGPFTRDQIRSVTSNRPERQVPEGTGKAVRPPVRAQGEQDAVLIPDGVYSVYLPAEGEGLAYCPYAGVFAKVHYSSARYRVDETGESAWLAEAGEGPVPLDWDDSFEADIDPALLSEGLPEGDLEPLPGAMMEKDAFENWSGMFLKWAPRNTGIKLFSCSEPKEVGTPGETRGEFVARLEMMRREKRDEDVEKLRKKYASRFNTLQNRLLRAEQAIERESEQASQRKMDTVVSFGSALASAFLGRKINVTAASRVGTAISKAGRLKKEKEDVARAEERAGSVREEIEKLESRLADEIEEIKAKTSEPVSVEEVMLRPKRSDVSIVLSGLVWLPWRKNPQGGLEPLWRSRQRI